MKSSGIWIKNSGGIKMAVRTSHWPKTIMWKEGTVDP